MGEQVRETTEQRIAAVVAAHWEIAGTQGEFHCDGCNFRLGDAFADHDASLRAHLAAVLVAAGVGFVGDEDDGPGWFWTREEWAEWLAEHDAQVRKQALIDAADALDRTVFGGSVSRWLRDEAEQIGGAS